MTLFSVRQYLLGALYGLCRELEALPAVAFPQAEAPGHGVLGSRTTLL